MTLDFAPPPPEPRRIPNLLHLFLLLGITIFALFLGEGVLAALHPHAISEALQNQRLQLYVNIGTYVVALAIAAVAFPLLWHKTFLSGISFNRRQAPPWLIVVGLVLGFLSQGASSILPMPRDAPIEKIFATPGIIWVVTVFGVIVAPIFEEIVFRGFLLPGLAIVIDYLRLPRPADPLEAMSVLTTWRASTSFSRGALIASSLITSLCFALIHAPQLAFAWTSVGLLVCVSLVLCWVRIRFQSVAASTVVHISYNLSIFVTLFVATGGYRHLEKM
jgi:membrane protease YdiL (CAAX protease family)